MPVATRVIHSYWLMRYLVSKGFPVIKTYPKPSNPIYDEYVFNDSQALRDAMTDYRMHSRRFFPEQESNDDYIKFG